MNPTLNSIMEKLQKFQKNNFMKKIFAKEMPKRDITGECDGDCRDRVKEEQSRRQNEIDSMNL